MNEYVIKLSFKTPVHFGNGRLVSSENFMYADTLFSAFYKEAIKLNGVQYAEELRKSAENGKFRISDLLPFCGQTLFIPKPYILPESDNSPSNKKLKKLKFLPVNDLTEYLSGNYNPNGALDMLNSLGKYSVRTNVKINQYGDNTPFNVGIFTFNKDAGLYFVAQCEDLSDDILFDVLYSLSYTGIGGELSSGLGKFDYQDISINDKDISKSFYDRLHGKYKRYMSLSVSMPSDSELDNAMKNSGFEIIKRSGYVSSDSYSDKPLRKNNLYCFNSGSVFENKFNGIIADVSDNGYHPVYKYAKPLWFGID
ncbi:MAG: type III-A CRISPR-associated RAMP protein Csm4 [Acutalibacteraceae bacterium]